MDTYATKGSALESSVVIGPENTQFARALERVRAESVEVDPEACVARFGSAF